MHHMKIVITGGGTGGHTSPGLAVAAALRNRGAECAWIGSRDGIEARRAPEAAIPFHAIPAGKLRRYWSWRNLGDLTINVPAGFGRAVVLLGTLRPQVVFATGGYVALPVVLAAAIRRLPIVVHEQTAVPGLANRLAAPFARAVALTFPESGRSFDPARCVVTGNPLRPELRHGSAERAAAAFALDPDLPLIYVTGGAQGAHRINRAVGEALPGLLAVAQMIHQCGDNAETGDRQWLEGQRAALPPSLRERYRVVPYVGAELADVYAATRLVIGRAGAGTVNECCQLGVPALYIPLPGTSGDEQTANARLVEAVGGCAVLPQAELTPERLTSRVRDLLADRPGLIAMGGRARSIAIPDAADRLADLLMKVART
jgi:UDP-N-acetylglucosamine--N-acetylmuramyl-(pentapeptide) pyrophosphoryl-undecaprenol N-acetylglucosamine transferase